MSGEKHGDGLRTGAPIAVDDNDPRVSYMEMYNGYVWRTINNITKRYVQRAYAR
jgi:hypothetical protein